MYLRPRYIKILKIAAFSLIVIFSFQNCYQGGLKVTGGDFQQASLSDPNSLGSTSSNQNSSDPSLSSSESLCKSLDSLQGDMRVSYNFSDKSDSVLEFGTFADNYWGGNGQVYDRELTFNIQNKDLVTVFSLVQAAYDDWLLVSINGINVYIGPKKNADRLEVANGQVCYTDKDCSQPELSTSWNFALNIDIKPFLKNGLNVIKTKTIVAGGGESAIKFNVNYNCSVSN